MAAPAPGRCRRRTFDRRRQLAVIDPDGRAMLVSVGAAVFNLRVAVRAHGRENRVSYLPDPGEPDLAARVTLERAIAPPADVLALADAIPRWHTNRRPFADRPLPHGTTHPRQERVVP